LFEILLVFVALAAVVLIVTGPLRKARPDSPATGDDVAELEAAREAKYREIRDAELDHATGKLSTDDYQATDTTLRAEAIAILHALDQAREARAEAQMPAAD
jgi:hypothetical protein